MIAHLRALWVMWVCIRWDAPADIRELARTGRKDWR